MFEKFEIIDNNIINKKNSSPSICIVYFDNYSLKYNKLEHDSVLCIHCEDPNLTFGFEGFGSECQNFYENVEKLKAIFKNEYPSIKKIYTVGWCFGSFCAILYGSFLRAEKVFVCSVLSTLDYQKDRELLDQDVRFSDEYLQKVSLIPRFSGIKYKQISKQLEYIRSVCPDPKKFLRVPDIIIGCGSNDGSSNKTEYFFYTPTKNEIDLSHRNLIADELSDSNSNVQHHHHFIDYSDEAHHSFSVKNSRESIHANIEL